MKVIPLAVVAFVSAASCASLAPGAANTPTGRASASAEAVSAAPTGSAAAQSGRSAAPSTTGSPTPAERAARAPALTAQRSGADLVITLSGLTPGEGGELTVRWSTRAPTGPITADATGEVHLRVLVGDDAPIEVVVRRASGEELRAAVGPSQAAPSAVPAVAAVPPSVVAPSGAPPSQTPTSRAGPRFTVAIEPADPPPGTAPDIVVGGLLAGEEFQLELTVDGGAADPRRVQADPTGSFRWRSPVPAGTSFQVAAVRLTGERASTALHAAAAPTASPAATEPACVTTGSADARTGTTGDFVLGGRPMAGLTVEIREWVGGFTGTEGCLTCRLFGTGVTDAQGHVVVMGLPPGVLVEAVVPDARYTRFGPRGSFSRGTEVCASKIVSPTTLDGPRVLYWNVTGFEIGVRGIGGRPTDGIETLHWDPVPGATSYCLQMFDKGPPPYQFRTSITTGSCMDLADHAALTTPTFHTPALVAGDRGYDVRIVAFTGTYASGVFAGGFRKSE